MDHRLVSAMGSEQALDFTSTPKRESPDQIPESCSPVLDLSCKSKHSESGAAPSCSLSPVSIEAISNPPSIDNSHIEQNESDHHHHHRQHSRHHHHHRHNAYESDERKSPFEARNFMVTPPSESDSPRKPKYETIYVRMDATSESSSEDTSRYGLLPATIGGGALPACPADILSSIAMPRNGVVPAPPALHLPSVPVATLGHEISVNNASQDGGAKKAPRPFKAYPKDPLTMSIAGATELVYDQTSTEAYSEFRKRMLESVRRTNEGTNIKMRRVTKSPGLPTSTMMDEKDAAYWERRRKNNEAAKRSRDARRAKEDEIAIRAAFLEQENMKLKYELVALRNETAKLRCMIYTN